MNWLILAVVSYLILALVNLGDKFIVDKLLKSSKTYVFIVSVLGAVVVILSPWFLTWPGLSLLIVNLTAGALFSLALWAMYEALKKGEASRVTVVIGSVIPVFTVIFSLLFLKEKFTGQQWLGIMLLVVGMLLISFIASRKNKYLAFLKRLLAVFSGAYDKKWIFLALLAAFLYALYFIMSKYAYSQQDFLSSFIWIRIGGALLAGLFLLDRDTRREIKKNLKAKPGRKKTGRGFVVLNQISGALASFMQSYAVYLGPVALINALQGIQYAFLLILGIFFSVFFPKILREDISRPVLIKKIAAIILVGFGLYFIVV